MMFSKAFMVAIVAFLAEAVSSHMIMAQPIPFGKPDNSPLSPAGSDYPCKLPQTNGFQGSAQLMPSGSQQTLAFSGSASHAGGSCQISLTKDSAPNAASAFKVIHSYHGGCPGADGSSKTFNFQMPSEVPNGNYVLAWTWFNRLGNREMYMNCAPIRVTGSSGSDSAFNGLPNMAIYNVQVGGQDTCKTIETTDVQFPDPGNYLTVDPAFKKSSPVGTNCGAVRASSGAGAGSSSGTFAEGSANNPSGTTDSPAIISPSGTFTTVYTPVSISTPSSSRTDPNTSSTPPASISSGADSGSSNGIASSSSSCDQPGKVICSIDGSRFGICNFGAVVMMPVAPGTTCSNGAISRRIVRRRNVFHW